MSGSNRKLPNHKNHQDGAMLPALVLNLRRVREAQQQHKMTTTVGGISRPRQPNFLSHGLLSRAPKSTRHRRQGLASPEHRQSI
jgi:hypothetical protein